MRILGFDTATAATTVALLDIGTDLDGDPRGDRDRARATARRSSSSSAMTPPPAHGPGTSPGCCP